MKEKLGLAKLMEMIKMESRNKKWIMKERRLSRLKVNRQQEEQFRGRRLKKM
jgi:hypothetical protein